MNSVIMPSNDRLLYVLKVDLLHSKNTFAPSETLLLQSNGFPGYSATSASELTCFKGLPTRYIALYSATRSVRAEEPPVDCSLAGIWNAKFVHDAFKLRDDTIGHVLISATAATKCT